MSKKRLRISLLLIIAICMSSFSCTSTNYNMLKDSSLKLQHVPYKSIRISEVVVQKENSGIEISGKVKNRGVMHAGFGHVDISIISPEGAVLKELSTHYIPSLSINKGRHSHGSQFNINTPFIPPHGSKVLIAYHRGTIMKNKVSNCDENRATLALETI